MRLKSIEYQEFGGSAHAWSLDKLTLAPINLLVGRNATGKSRVLHVILSLARLLSGQLKEVPFSGSFLAVFDHNESTLQYFLKIENSLVIGEDFDEDGDNKLHREAGGPGWILANDIDGKPQRIRFQPSPRELGVVVRRDPYQHPFLQPLHDWGATVSHFEFGKTMGHANLGLAVQTPVPLPETFDTDQIVPIFNAAVKRFGDAFVTAIKRDMGRIDYQIENLTLAPPSHMILSQPLPGNLMGLAAKERGLECATEQHHMSQGMFRALSLLIQVNYALLQRKPACVLVDDIGEGLDFERSCALIDLLREKAQESNVQLILSTNDRFVMNKVPLEEWVVLQRVGSHVRVRNYENSREVFDEFKYTGLSNFDFFATDFLNEEEQEAVGHDQAGDVR